MAKFYRKYPWKQIEHILNIKLKWYEKINVWIQCKIFNIKDYFTNPDRIIDRKFSKNEREGNNMECFVVVWGEDNEGYDILDIYKSYKDAVERMKAELNNHTGYMKSHCQKDRYERGCDYIEIQTYSIK